jgi:hypothetical protein
MGWLARQDGYDPDAFDVPGEQTYDRRLDQTWPGRLVQEAMGAVLAPGRALQSTEPITTEQMIKPAADLAGLVTGGSYAAPAQKGASGAGIRAYHSSPHDFDKFDIAKIGTGEGAQAYGHGLYFAESPAVSGQGGQYWNQFLNRSSPMEWEAAMHLEGAGFDRVKALAQLESNIEQTKARLATAGPHAATDRVQKVLSDWQAQRDLLASGNPVGPRTYEVNINADPAHMLDWDKALSQQHERVQQAVEPLRSKWRSSYASDPGGQQIYQNLSASMPGWEQQVAATQTLREAGIPGIKYLDQGSRAVPTKIQWAKDALANPRIPDVHDKAREVLAKWEATPISSNYVIFDPNLIRIDKKYALPLATGAGMGALAAQDRYE